MELIGSIVFESITNLLAFRIILDVVIARRFYVCIFSLIPFFFHYVFIFKCK